MAVDILSQQQIPLLGVYQLGQQVLTISTSSGGSNNQIIATGVELQYGRQNTPFVPLNRKGKILISGIPSGMLRIQTLVGPMASIKGFLKGFSGNPCSDQNSITLSPCLTTECQSSDLVGAGVVADTFTCNGCVISGIQVSASQLGGGMMVLIGSITLDVISVS